MNNPLKLQLMIFHGALVVLAIGILAALKLAVPAVGLLMLLSPLAFAYYCRRYDLIATGILVTVMSLVLFFLQYGDFLTTLFIYGPLGMVMGYRKWRGLEDIYRLAISVATSFLGVFLWYNGFNLILGEGDFIDYLVADMKRSFSDPEFLKLFQDLNNSISPNLQNEIIDITLSIMPSLLFMALLLYGISLLTLDRFVEKKTLKRKQVERLSPIAFELPAHILNGATILLLGSLLVQLVSPALGAVVLQNIVIIMMSVFAIQGINVVNHILKINRFAGFIRLVIILASIMFLQLFGLGVIGWLDMIFGIRKRLDNR